MAAFTPDAPSPTKPERKEPTAEQIAEVRKAVTHECSTASGDPDVRRFIRCVDGNLIKVMHLQDSGDDAFGCQGLPSEKASRCDLCGAMDDRPRSSPEFAPS